MKLEIKLKNIDEIAQQKEAENLSFQKYLKEQNSEKIDAIVHRLNDEVTPKISCLDCGNCCMNLRPVATDEEVGKFVKKEDIEKYKYQMSFSCTHLKDKGCTIYSERHDECRSYPYLDRNEFTSRVTGVLQNYKICPIVFNVFELLKTETGWRFNNEQ